MGCGYNDLGAIPATINTISTEPGNMRQRADGIELACSWNFMTFGIDNLAAMCAITDFLDHVSGPRGSIKETGIAQI
jgi:hypothetical protein